MNRSHLRRYAMARTGTTAVIAAFNPGGVMQYLPGLYEMSSRQEIDNFYIGSTQGNVKASDTDRPIGRRPAPRFYGGGAGRPGEGIGAGAAVLRSRRAVRTVAALDRAMRVKRI
jgi:hypothetical protein